MLYDKAIEILDLNIKEAGKKMPPDILDALKLGRQAVAYCRDVHRFPHLAEELPLPSQGELRDTESGGCPHPCPSPDQREN